MPHREREIGDLLNQIVSAVRREIGQHSAELGLTRFEWAVLRHLHSDRLAGMSSSSTDALFARLEMRRGRLNDILDALLARGLVQNVWGQGWRISSEGVRMSEPLLTIGDSIMTKATSGFTRDELERLADMLGRVSDNVGAARPHVDQR